MTSWKREANVWRKFSVTDDSNNGSGLTTPSTTPDKIDQKGGKDQYSDVPDQSKGLIGVSRLQQVSRRDVNHQILATESISPGKDPSSEPASESFDEAVTATSTSTGGGSTSNRNDNSAETEPVANDTSTLQLSLIEPLPEKISTINTIFFPELVPAKMLPAGSAVYTSSGDLAKDGILAIIHAATGSLFGRWKTVEGKKSWDERFEPSVKSVKSSILNSLRLASNFNHKVMAIPFIGGSIFLRRIGVKPEVLASEIVKTALEHRFNVHVRFVAFSKEDEAIFQRCLDAWKTETHYEVPEIEASVVLGDITKFTVHQGDVIVNCSNMEVTFGAGLSGAVADAVGNFSSIDKEAHELIASYHEKAIANSI